MRQSTLLDSFLKRQATTDQDLNPPNNVGRMNTVKQHQLPVKGPSNVIGSDLLNFSRPITSPPSSQQHQPINAVTPLKLLECMSIESSNSQSNSKKDPIVNQQKPNQNTLQANRNVQQPKVPPKRRTNGRNFWDSDEDPQIQMNNQLQISQNQQLPNRPKQKESIIIQKIKLNQQNNNQRQSNSEKPQSKLAKSFTEPQDQQQDHQELDEQLPYFGASQKANNRSSTGRLSAATSNAFSRISEGGRQSESKIRATEGTQDQPAGFTDATPPWALPQSCLDAQRRAPNHPLYDPTTLYVPKEAWKEFSAPMRQYWTIKSQNFDKIVLFKLGKFYEIFYEDAAISNKYLELKFMGTKMHTGFPQKCLDRYAGELVRLGFKVVVVEQTETPEDMAKRNAIEKREGKKPEKTINREVTQILTKGTIVPEDKDENYLPNYLICIRALREQVFGFCLLEAGTNSILMGYARDLSHLKTVLFQTRPVELLYDPDNLSFATMDIMRSSMLQMIVTRLSNRENVWHSLNAKSILENEFQNKGRSIPGALQFIGGSDETQKTLIFEALAGLFCYLGRIKKYDEIVAVAKYHVYGRNDIQKFMVLDSQALQHLEVFDTSFGTAGSLFDRLDKTSTKFGRRLLRRWLTSPLYNQSLIEDRLNALEDLQAIRFDRDRAADIFKKVPDLEKSINRLYHYAVKSTNNNKAVFFEDVNTNKLKEYKQLIGHFNDLWKAITLLRKNMDEMRSWRLKTLLSLTLSVGTQSASTQEHPVDRQGIPLFQEDTIMANSHAYQATQMLGLLPPIPDQLDELTNFIRWVGDIPKPKPGLLPNFDQLQKQETALHKALEKQLEQLRFQMKESNLKFAHTKERYEIEVPQRADRNKPKDFLFSSKRAGYNRYTCKAITELVKQLEKIEQSLKQQMAHFVGFFFQQFQQKQMVWQRYISIVAELDCLISMSVYSFQPGHCRPAFGSSQTPIQIRQGKHPCLASLDFVPNDIDLSRRVMLLSGPNMGGKSTILRTACLLAIVAQLGCYVPAQSYHAPLIDRIFTRIGASDRLSEGKSTFFIEMEETKSVLLYATPSSLAIMDELGRGTSTFDGMAIAYSVLHEIVSNIGCFCVFATHYHNLIHEFGGCEGVSLMKMDSIVGDQGLIFLYKLREGAVQQSFGVNVAQMVGIESSIIQQARKKSLQMQHIIEQKRKRRQIAIE